MNTQSEMKDFGTIKSRLEKAYKLEDEEAIAKGFAEYYLWTEVAQPPYPDVMPKFNAGKYPRAFRVETLKEVDKNRDD